MFIGYTGRFSFQSLDTFLKTQQEALETLEQQNQSTPQIHPNENNDDTERNTSSRSQVDSKNNNSDTASGDSVEGNDLVSK
jgi:hypothetical protein